MQDRQTDRMAYIQIINRHKDRDQDKGNDMKLSRSKQKVNQTEIYEGMIEGHYRIVRMEDSYRVDTAISNKEKKENNDHLILLL